MFVAGDVAGNVFAASFGVAHFAEDASAGADDAFDGVGGAVGVELNGVRGLSLRIAILEGDLALNVQTGEGGGVGDEASFAVREGQGVDFPSAHFREPGCGNGGGADARVGIA